MNNIVNPSLSTLSLAVILALSGKAYAEDSDTENESKKDENRVVVTANFRAKDIQNLPASVTVLSKELVEKRQAQHLEDILNAAANVNFASGASRGRFVQIRGIGERSQFSEPVNPSVGFVIDDFDYSGIAGVGTLFDVEQVEILRGPQATEFGASAMAGMVKVKTADADEHQTTRFTATVAEKNTWSLGGATGGELAEDLFFRVAIQQYKSDGFIKNIHLNRDDTTGYDEFTGRLKLKYRISQNSTLDVHYQRIDIDNGYDDFSLDNDGLTRSDEPGFDQHKTNAFGVKWQHEVSSGQWVAIASHSTSDLGYGYDEDWTFVGFHPDGYQSKDHYLRDRDTTSVDLRFLSNQTSALFNGSTDWVAGVYLRNIEESLLRQYTFASSDFSSQYKPQSRAVYVNTETALTDKVSLNVGLRADNYQIDYADSSGFSSQSDETIVGGKVVANYAMGTSDLYTSISRGYKAGGFNPDERVSQDKRLFEPEYNWNYELGLKNRLADLNGYVRVAVFYMDRENTQISDFDVQTRPDGSSDFIDIIDNADVGKNYGVEFESGFQLTDNWRVNANIGYLRASFEGYQLANGTTVEKQDQAQSPRYTFNMASDLAITDNISWYLVVEGKDDFRFSDGHNEMSPSFTLVNTSLSYQLEDWQLSLWAKNLLDREYYVRGFGGFSNDPRDGYSPAEPYFQLGNGRQVGLTLNYSF
ncbi:TonB-dependent receptor [Pleionea sp. CnH1-48]|uniref:TonB-dependent receptor n=1 Tax=Pleionea sp. CnH1-48 TaxID=2954494 RepID=UPI002096CBAB|nr:TonB-dependent receptor [Pleionea sp. CnH1-48]MCO7224367.1 TonB-dependent receptor [Pleionea sp. CnH1-48]